jgi:VanZ family protein
VRQASSSWWAAWGPVGLWVALIFGLSSDNFSASATSGMLDPLLRWLLPGLSDASIRTLHGMVRKCAHVSVYAGLALLVLRALRARYAAPLLRAGALSLAFVIAVASLDETHQGFSIHRTGSLLDVGLDLLGGGLALVLVTVVLLSRSERRRSAPES